MTKIETFKRKESDIFKLKVYFSIYATTMICVGRKFVGSSRIQLKEPTLKTCTLFEQNQLKSMLESIFKLPIGQGIGTITRTSQNEAFNRVKLIYTSRLIDYSASYQTRRALAILHNNEGICEMVNIARQDSNTP